MRSKTKSDRGMQNWFPTKTMMISLMLSDAKRENNGYFKLNLIGGNRKLLLRTEKWL